MSPQTNISYNGIQGQPGQAFDAEVSNRDVVSVMAAVNIPFGVACEFNSSGLAVPMKDSTTGGSFVPQFIGVSMIDPLGVEENYVTFPVPAATTGSTSSGWLAGMLVPFMRRGRIWVLTDGGGTFLQYGAINVNHSSTGAHAQGVFTYTAVQSTAGNEIDICPNCTVWNPSLIGGVTGPTFTDSFGNTFNTLVVEINL
jgi:hypothetical protein